MANTNDQIKAVIQAIEYMKIHLTKEITSEELAFMVGYSPYHFSRVFKEVTCVSPRHYLSALRIEAGKEILVNSSSSTLKTLLLIGFRSLGTFSSKFKQSVGLSPKQFQMSANDLHQFINQYENQEKPVQNLRETNVVASIGHSDASYEEAVKSFQAGFSHATHLFNGMRGMHHREPGVVGSVLLHDEVIAEIIADGIHVRPEMIQLTYKLKGKDGIILVTDAMRAKCLGEGSFDLGGQNVTVKNEMATLSDGTLAGSILKMKDAAKNMMNYTGCDLKELICMTSVNAAKLLKIDDRKGSLTIGKDADILVLSDTLEVYMTICRGTVAFQLDEAPVFF
ncbi:N-acetylglucosamine-6-phosphate deacetylase [Bacillus sp. DJP31]|uniref:N-acetylglucosamine-6-phosphate deacetylase n=1 Tax=Bacillus sp. DJP31 TaxID=3409789 RepID=UPI003BB57D2F